MFQVATPYAAYGAGVPAIAKQWKTGKLFVIARADPVAREMADLRKKNRSLVAKVNRLEREAREKPAAGNDGWEEERREIRDRVERLAGDLEGLLEEE